MSGWLGPAVLLVVAGVGGLLVVRSRPSLAQRLDPYRGRTPGTGPDTGAFWAPLRRVDRVAGAPAAGGLGARLRAAGLSDGDADRFRTRQYTQTAIGAACGLVLGAALLHSTVLAAVGVVVGAAVGHTRGPARLARAADERRTRMRLELVTIDQVLAIHVRAGAGPVQAITRVAGRGEGAVVDELHGIIASIRAGRSESDAFRHAARCTAEPHAARTYRLFALAAEQGADLGVALRALSDDLRAVRRDELRRQATRRRAAMLVPTIAVLAPIMLLFVIAPLPSIVLGGR
ncbi:MAG: type II secretion system F family protein [Actinobacteria bacterium]|nr:type II secretion system F family protein [Actinomycetota bacterium]